MEGKKVLVVDDEFTIRYLVEHQLKRSGFESIMAKDGPSALIAAREHKPDLIVLDIMMPGMDGFEVCQQIKGDPELASTPVIFLSALSSKKDKLRAFEMGADDYLIKPFQADEFRAHIMAVLRRSSDAPKAASQRDGRVVAFFSPKGGVGVSTLTVQLSEALVLRERQKVVLVDLNLPLGGLAAMLKLYTTRHIAGLLNDPDAITLDAILRFTQRHRANLRVLPAPGQFIQPREMPSAANLVPMLDVLSSNGYHVALDLGSYLTPLAVAAMKRAHTTFVLTSGQPVANHNLDTFLTAAHQIGLDSRRLLPVINELHGPVDDVKLTRIPTARIPHASERSRTRLWLQEQGLHKLVSVILS
ncbi:MAG: response regulator [Chloroflexi bacterium]|nr:response regulator [Chloroflexota bacterium]